MQSMIPAIHVSILRRLWRVLSVQGVRDQALAMMPKSGLGVGRLGLPHAGSSGPSAGPS